MRLLTVPAAHKLVWEDIPKPTPGLGQIRVAVTHVGICGSDLEVFQGRRLPHVENGHPVIGHEMCGVVDAVGAQVRGLQLDDPVAVVGAWGAFSDYVVTVPENVLRLGKRIDPADGCLVEVLPGAAMAAWKTGIVSSSRVLVVGQGLSGLLVSRLVKLHGCARLTVVEPHPCRLDLAREMGADVCITGRIEERLPELKRSCPEGFDVAIVTSRTSVVNSLAPVMRPRSHIVLYGGLETAASIDVMALHHRSISLVKESEGINGVLEARSIWAAAAGLVEDGVLPLHRLRTHERAFLDVEEAFHLRLDDPTALHVVCFHPDAVKRLQP